MNSMAMWVMSSFPVGSPLPRMATPFICIMARRIHASPWPQAVFVPYLSGWNNNHEQEEVECYNEIGL